MRTNLYTLLCIAVRLAAITLALDTLLSTIAIYEFSHNPDAIYSLGVILALACGQLVVALLLWRYPGALARWAARDDGKEVFESPIAAADLQYIAFSLLGAYFLIGGGYMLIHQLTRDLILRYGPNHADREWSYFDATTIASWIAAAFQIVAGGGLMLGARGVVAMLSRARDAGLPNAETPTSQETT